MSPVSIESLEDTTETGARTAARAFAAGWSRPPGPLPEPLRWSLRERAALLARGALTAAEFGAEADPWAFAADTHYRACSELREGESPVRLGVKDTVDVAGFATRLGLRRHRHYPRRSAAPLTGLRGLSTVAKLVTTELNLGIGSGCGNPYFPRLDPAGSSTGCGVAVAAGICDLALGTDVLGSVRWPAGRCGVVGLRLTHTDRLHGVFPLCPSMDAPGWVARTADDLAYAAGHCGLPIGPVPAGPYRVGVVTEALATVEPEILDGVRTTIELLRTAGHAVTEVRVGEPWSWRSAAWELCARAAWDALPQWRGWLAEDLGPATEKAVAAGADVTDARLHEIVTAQHRLRVANDGWFAGLGVDALLLPLDPKVPAPRDPAEDRTRSTIPLTRTRTGIDHEDDIGYTPLASFTGLPALTFPVATARDGVVPVAMQLVGRPHADGELVSLACDAERVRGPLGFAPR
jgi:Asp-tRNA(Asn)/Glu-tRNA(Gln) amidotransferase A subunit family amidase